MAQYDLLGRMSKYMDAHLLFPLLEFTQTCGIYKEDDLLRAKIELLKRTNMVDYAIDIYNAVNKTDQGSDELRARREEVVARMRQLQVEAEPITAFISDPAKVDTLRGEKTHNSTFMQEEYGIGAVQVDALLHFAKFQFECGNYEATSEYLHHFRTYSLDADKNLSALWGKLASEILMTHYDQAVETIARLREMIDTVLFADALKQMEQRTWLLHWSLFVFWNVNDGRSKLVEMFMSERFMAALQINAPHLLRYLAAALLVNKTDKDRSNKWNSHLQQLMRVVVAEVTHYSDPVLEFLKCVYRDFDFDLAQEKLRECEVLIDSDFFLAAVKTTFMEQARMAIFEVYCRIHQCIDLNMLADRLSMQREEAEKWIANLIRNARLNARIDSTAGTVVMGTQYIDPLDAIVDRNNQLSVRTFKLANSIIDMTGGEKAVAV